MDIQQYIDSGVLEEYCMGLLSEGDQAYLIQMTMLYPEVKEALTLVELTFEKFAGFTAIEPDPSVKQNVLAAIDFDQADLSLNNLPVISHAGDPQPWLKALAHLIPNEPTEDFICHVIREDDKVRQMLVITKTDVPDEEHGDFLESFFILDGHCECTVGESFYALGAGEFIEMPLRVKHNIKLTTPVVTAILQYKFV
ncbi:MAG: hypothetical protein JWQ84_128 [Mucilaginibacter sp.]|jgi:mannose-6-phosphate isomerase-like protein (cupin superfamily)|nr:hypothetical protein [Mucilaginibacter sp.]MDB5139539.1 hypothetical protein [Mucilaginibacter sp.]